MDGGANMTDLLRNLWLQEEGQDIAEYSGWHNPIDWNEREECLFRNRQFNWPIASEQRHRR
jgi:hypothetical protein